VTPRRVVLGIAVALGAAGGLLVYSLRSSAAPRPALPELHGQQTWAPGAHPAPALPALRSFRGRTALVALAAPRCPGCAQLRAELASIVRRLPAADRPRVVFADGPRTPIVLLVDRAGDERTGYLFPFPPAFVEGDLRILAAEPRP